MNRMKKTGITAKTRVLSSSMLQSETVVATVGTFSAASVSPGGDRLWEEGGKASVTSEDQCSKVS